MNIAIPRSSFIPLYVELIDLTTRMQLFFQILTDHLPIATELPSLSAHTVRPFATVSLEPK